MKKRNIFSALIICLGLAGAFALSAPRKEQSGSNISGLQEPVVKEDDTLSTGQVTEWPCITFGSYPQTEIIRAPSDAVDDYAVQDGDFLEDAELYDKLAAADWNENETEIDGTRYLRVQRDQISERDQHYRWGSDEQWHYFRFDPIVWRVIALENGNALLMADKLLDSQPFHLEDGPVTWEKSTLRSWLNGLGPEDNSAGIDYKDKGFVDTAFSDHERGAIMLTTVENKPNARYETDCGGPTQDFVFLLSNEEVFGSDLAARHGFYPKSGKDDPAKRFRSTMYAKCKGAWWSSVDGYKGNSFWFMRTNGYTQESVTYICDFGYIYQRGTISTCDDAGVLPALWINLEQADYEAAGTVSSKDIEDTTSSDSSQTVNQKDKIVNPVVTDDENQPDGKSVTYTLVQFGNYPQTEILPDASHASSHSIVDEKLYDALENGDWQNNEWIYDDQKYLKVTDDQSGAVHYFLYEPLVWRVLEVQDGTALLMSDSALDCEPFQTDLQDVSWENCTLRSYLNGYSADENAASIDYSREEDNFLDKAFTKEEQNAILEDFVRNEENYYFDVDSGDTTMDKIFIPAESELFIHDSSVIHGFSRQDAIADRAKQFQPTDYALWKGVWSASDSGNVFWITRTTGYTHSNVVYVDESGYMYNRGILVTCPDAAVIPCLILDLDSLEYEYAGTFSIGN